MSTNMRHTLGMNFKPVPFHFIFLPRISMILFHNQTYLISLINSRTRCNCIGNCDINIVSWNIFCAYILQRWDKNILFQQIPMRYLTEIYRVLWLRGNFIFEKTVFQEVQKDYLLGTFTNKAISRKILTDQEIFQLNWIFNATSRVMWKIYVCSKK